MYKIENGSVQYIMQTSNVLIAYNLSFKFSLSDHYSP